MTKEIRILLIEDNLAFAGLLNFVLNEDKKHDWKIKHVISLKAALDCLNQECYDLVISDYSLDECAGKGPIQAIKDKNSDIPIVIISAHDEEELSRLTQGKGAAKVFSKENISSEEFREGIVKVIEDRPIKKLWHPSI